MVIINTGNYSVKIFGNKEKVNITNNKPDYSLEIFDIEKEFDTTKEFKGHIRNCKIMNSCFFNLKFGELFINLCNVYLYFDEYNKTFSDLHEKYENKQIKVSIKEQTDFFSHFTFQLCFLKFAGIQLLTNKVPLFLKLLEYYISNMHIKHVKQMPLINTTVGFDESGDIIYYFNSFDDLVLFDFYQMSVEKPIVKQCANCGKYFIPISRSDEIYCDNEYRNEKTCKQLGYEVKVSKDELLKPYRTAYKTQHAKMQRNKTNMPNYKKKYFDVWVSEAKKKLKQAKDGSITANEFKQWLNEKQ